MNSQVLIDRVFLQDLLFLLKQPRTKIDARAVLVFGIERAIDQINSEALSGYAELRARIAELEAALELERNRLVACGVVALANTQDSAAKVRQMHPDYMSASCQDVMRVVDAEIGLRAKLDASKFCANVADDLLAELAEAKETISRYEVTAENCDVLRAELANQLEVKAFWIGRTRALEVELAALKEKALVIPAWLIDEDQMASRLEQAGWFPTHDAQWSGCEMFRSEISSLLSAAPVAKQVVMPEALDRAFITGESCDGVYRVVIQSETLKEMQSVHNWIVRLNAADHSEDVRAMVPDGWLVEKMADNGVSGFIVRTPRAEGVRTCTAVFPDDDDPAHRLLAMLLASPAAKGVKS